jgi:hypothetical protein
MKHSQALWALAKLGRGRSRKPADKHARRVLISLDPELFALVEAFAAAKGLRPLHILRPERAGLHGRRQSAPGRFRGLPTRRTNNSPNQEDSNATPTSR